MYGKKIFVELLGFLRKEKKFATIKVLKKQIELEKAKKPGYWELFAEFYYSNADNVPEYCRHIEGTDHAFKMPQKICLKRNGLWESEYND